MTTTVVYFTVDHNYYNASSQPAAIIQLFKHAVHGVGVS